MMKRAKHVVALIFACLTIVLPVGAAENGAASISVHLSKESFNPTLGQKVEINVSLAGPGKLTADVVDRDLYTIRSLAKGMPVAQGITRLEWDGRDGQSVVPDEAYSFHLTFIEDTGKISEYFPAKGFAPVEEKVTKTSFSRWDGIISYTLAHSARVHLQAGQGKTDPKTGESTGPVLVTIVDRQPRIFGAVLEHWDGFDQSKTISLPELPDFALSVVATSLPENSVITTGNRKLNFISYALKNRPKEYTKPRHLPEEQHLHHHGLNAMEDHSPVLSLHVEGLSQVTVSIDDPAAAFFLAQPNELQVYIDEKNILVLKNSSNPATIVLPPNSIPPGSHRLVVDWVSAFGPVGVAATKISNVDSTHKEAGR